MADTITSSKELKVVAEFYDSDNRTITKKNPKNNLSADDVWDFLDYAKDNNAIIGDKAGASLTGASSAKIVEKSTIKYDLT